MALTEEESLRYSRQLALPEIGPAGQEKLRAARVAVVGAGGLGSPVLAYLAGAGVGEIGVFDSGPVELSNLHRQPLYAAADVGTPKTAAARRRLLEANPGITVVAREGRLTGADMAAALAPYRFAADCCDNFATRAALNRACLELGIPFVHAAVGQMEGQLAVFDPRRGPCLECMWPGIGSEKERSGAEAGILGPAAGAIGCLQAAEIIKLILGLGGPAGRFLMFDLRGWTVTAAEIKKRPDCPVCGSYFTTV
ncbi:MAG TPA: HesA/MoeB/ThiF family protein [Elusimicrobiales bacterium]|nr:HesA/MoeB/ThiF family protein [Elusimicrobiales bacterium]